MPNPDLCIRITLPYEDCSGIIQQWYSRCTEAICYQHDADEEIKKTHVHLVLIGLDCKTEALKRMWSDAPGKGNEFWSFSPLKTKVNYLAYMANGSSGCAKLAKNISQQQVEQAQEVVANLVKDSSSTSKDPTEFMMAKVLERFEHYSDIDVFIESYRHNRFFKSTTVFHGNDDYCKYLLHEVRSETMKVYWGVNRRVPHATQYKTVAGSVFLVLCERLNLFSSGIEQIKNLWY